MNTRPLRCVATLSTLLALNVMYAQDAVTAEQDKDAKVDPLQVFEAREFEAAGDFRLPYRLLKPAGFQAENRNPDLKYPLVIFLHGAGERGDDNERQLIHGGRNFAAAAMRNRHPAFIVAPQCPAELWWVNIPGLSRSKDTPDSSVAPLEAVLKLVESLQQEFPIESKRIYAVGLSMGGFGTWTY